MELKHRCAAYWMGTEQNIELNECLQHTQIKWWRGRCCNLWDWLRFLSLPAWTQPNLNHGVVTSWSRWQDASVSSKAVDLNFLSCDSGVWAGRDGGMRSRRAAEETDAENFSASLSAVLTICWVSDGFLFLLQNIIATSKLFYFSFWLVLF